jgi:uncharacterized membrane protein YedE/YeeE
MIYVIALILGVFFGFALNKAGLTKYHKIVNQFRLTDMAVLKFMMTALVVTMLGVYPLRALGIITFPAIPETYIVGNLVGGLIFGVGMALAGFCPGTAVAGAGEGKWDYIVPGLLGFLTGAVIFGLTYTSFMPQLKAIGNYGSVVLPDLWHINPYLAVLVFTIMALVLFYLIDRMGMIRKEKKD